MGVWIETKESDELHLLLKVTPFVGVWIETLKDANNKCPAVVTPFVGVWIETANTARQYEASLRSHPSWVCGLKPALLVHPQPG